MEYLLGQVQRRCLQRHKCWIFCGFWHSLLLCVCNILSSTGTLKLIDCNRWNHTIDEQRDDQALFLASNPKTNLSKHPACSKYVCINIPFLFLLVHRSLLEVISVVDRFSWGQMVSPLPCPHPTLMYIRSP